MSTKDPLKTKLNELLNRHSLAELFRAMEALIEELDYPEIAEHLRQSQRLLPNSLLRKSQIEDKLQ